MDWAIRCGCWAAQASDIGHAAALIEGLRPAHVLADKGYDADHFRDATSRVIASR